MIPKVNDILSTNIEFESEPSNNYKMWLNTNRIVGKSEELEAMKQVIFKILNTERYKYIIYSWDYGIELEDLYGEPISYVCCELIDRITEALMQDDRIKSVDNFDFNTSEKNTIHVTFTVHTIFGDVDSEKVVNR